MKRWFIGGLFAVILLAGLWTFRGFFRDVGEAWSKPELPAPIAYRPTTATTATSTTKVTPTVKPAVPVKPSVDPFAFSGDLPKSVNLAVPFLSQAPQQNWDYPYQEACEEASAIMVDAFYDGRATAFKPDEGDKAILDLVAFEKKLFGYYEDTTAKEVKQLFEKYFQRPNVVIRERPTVEQLKAALANGYPVIVPASGKMLENPNFRNGGPAYHMLVLKGYLSDGRWITNDPGTRKGADFLYRQQNIMDAMHDWNGGDVTHGDQVVLIVLPE